MNKRMLGTNRIFNAPIETTWKLWTENNHLDHWWGPKGFTQTTHNFDFKINGQWSFVMHGPNGVDYPNEMVFLEIVPFEKIILRHESLPRFTITANFIIVDASRTRVDFTSVFDDEKTCEAVKDFAILGNVEHQIRFEAELSKLTGAIIPNEFVLTRDFHADLPSMWKMFTAPEFISKWYGPKEIKTGHCDMQFHRGGFYHFSMIAEDGQESWGKVYYVDIVKNNRLIYVSTFSNSSGEITRHPMAPLMPAELLTTIHFKDIGDGHTQVELRWYPINALPEEIKMFNDFHESFTMGWTGSFDRLDTCI